MKHTEVELLLEKYWEGETTLDDERALKAYFNAGQPIDERFRAVAPLFQALRAEQSVELHTARTVSMEPTAALSATPGGGIRRLWLAAASVALLVAAGWWITSQPVSESQPSQPVAAVTPTVPAPEITAPAATPAPAVDEPVVNHKPANAPTRRALADRPVKRPAAVRVAVRTDAQNDDAEAQQALEEIKAALALVSSKLRKGQQKATRGLQEIEHLDRSLEKIKENQG